MKPSEIPYFIAESMMHEVIHAIEKWADVEFWEERVEALIHKYSVVRGKLPADAEFEMPESGEQPEQPDIDIAEQLQNPTFVHINMLRGGIAKLSDANVKHMYPHLFEPSA
jgi:hypothetical protein